MQAGKPSPTFSKDQSTSSCRDLKKDFGGYFLPDAFHFLFVSISFLQAWQI